MCTVTVVPRPTGFRLVCNRDEQRTRPPAEPPELRRIGSMTTMWPRDPFSGGTWIGVNGTGLVMAVLNRRDRLERGHPGARIRSRGTIIPFLLGLERLDSAVARAVRLPAADFEPLTLVIVDRWRIAVLRNSRSRFTVRTRSLDRPLIFTSSSLGDDVVRRPRHALFARLVEHARSPLRGQAAFHRHRWPDRPELSVCMSRADARTVSRTRIDVEANGEDLNIEYTPLAER
jgi:hypothetical protein